MIRLLRLLCFSGLLLAPSGVAWAQPVLPPPPVSASEAVSYLVFLGANPIGREDVAVVEVPEGWSVRGSSRQGAPVDVVTEQAEVVYDKEWRPIRLLVQGTIRGVEARLETTFADGKAVNRIRQGEQEAEEVDEVSANAIVLPNTFLGSYAALARRLVGATAGTELRAYIAPQAELVVRVAALVPERIETPQRAINATRYSLTFANPGADLAVSLWADEQGRLLRLSVPAQRLELAREDIASAATRTAGFSIEGDETIRIPGNGFNIAATLTRPPGPVRPLPAVVLVGGSGPIDRDGFVAGIPVVGQMARALVQAGFVVVRYDKRGIGQSGGRADAATLTDYAEDLRAVVNYLERQRRRDVDRRRIAVVGHSEGAWVAMLAASRENKITAVALLAGGSTTGAEIVLEQQTHLLQRMKVPQAEAEAKIALQKQIHAALAGDGDWEGVPEELRYQAETPWFQSFLAFDPARVMRDTRQPVFIMQGALDTQVRPYHADRLAELARARRRNGGVEAITVPGVNHLFVSATTGEVDEYAGLAGREVSTAAMAALSLWLTQTMTGAK